MVRVEAGLVGVRVRMGEVGDGHDDGVIEMSADAASLCSISKSITMIVSQRYIRDYPRPFRARMRSADSIPRLRADVMTQASFSFIDEF